MTTSTRLTEAFNAALREVDKAAASGLRTADGESARAHLEQLRQALETERDAARSRGAVDPEWVRQTVRWVAEWTPESEIALIASLGGIARTLACFFVALLAACAPDAPVDLAESYRSAPRLELHEEVRYCADETRPGCQLDPTAFANTTPDGGVLIGTANGPVVRFDSVGTFVAAYGRQGSGPGEYRVLVGAHAERDGRVVLHDIRQSRRLVFAADGSPLLTLTRTPDFGMREFALHPRGLAVLSDPPAEVGDSVRTLVQLIRDTVPPFVVARVPLTRLRTAEGFSRIGAFFEDVPRWTIESDSTALVAQGPTLRVTRHFRDRPPLDVVAAPELGNRPVTDADIERERERRHPSASGRDIPAGLQQALEEAIADAESRAAQIHPFTAELRALSDGSFLLRDALLDADSARWTLFDTDGSVLGQLRLDPQAKVAGGRRDRLLLITPDERDVPVVGWFRVTRR